MTITKKQVLLLLFFAIEHTSCSESKTQKRSLIKTAAIITFYTAIPSTMDALSGAICAFSGYDAALRELGRNHTADSLDIIMRPKEGYLCGKYYIMQTKYGTPYRGYRTSNPIKFAGAERAVMNHGTEFQAMLQGAKMGVRSGLPSAIIIGIAAYGLTQAYPNSEKPTV